MEVGHSSWSMSLNLSASWELKPPFYVSKLYLCIFYSASVGRESQDLGQQDREGWLGVWNQHL